MPVTPEQLRRLAGSIKCQCQLHVEMAKGLRKIADQFEEAERRLNDELSGVRQK